MAPISLVSMHGIIYLCSSKRCSVAAELAEPAAAESSNAVETKKEHIRDAPTDQS
jgi:hypothetical protein